MRDLFAKGVLKLGGPFADGQGGAEVFDAASASEATTIVEANPAVKARVLDYELHPWLTVLRSSQ
jgi:uncharacterized protein YciI